MLQKYIYDKTGCFSISDFIKYVSDVIKMFSTNRLSKDILKDLPRSKTYRNSSYKTVAKTDIVNQVL